MIKIVGDVCYADGFFDIGFGVGSKLIKQFNPFENLKFNNEDFWIGNLECVISETSTRRSYDTKPFRINFDSIKHTPHLNIYSVANNHIMQHGPDAFNETISNLTKLGCQHVGSNRNRTTTFRYKEKVFGLLAFSQREEVFSDKPLYWLRPEFIEIEKEINSLQHCDFKIVYMHWGNEFINYPNVEQKHFARWLIDIGADIVIGTHPHVLQGFELYKGKHIFYSLGNFLFNMPSINTKYSAIVNIDVNDDKLTVGFEYVKINQNNQPAIINVDAVPEQFLFESLNSNICFEEDNEIYYRKVFQQVAKYRKKNYLWIIRNLYKHQFGELYNLLVSFVGRRL
jgi:poly-gamma-glutamate capsule biosynthesis protein CapA/YwtB (metallophosphatase superfamily)